MARPETVEERIAVAWPNADPKEVLRIGPLGTRSDMLLFNRRTGEVSTGVRGDGVCFKDSLDAFEWKLDRHYTDEVERYDEYLTGPITAKRYQRLRDEYRLVIGMLRRLPPLEP